MSREMLLNAAAPVCVEAVRLFAAELARATALRPVVEVAEDAVDVAFLDAGPSETALRVRWTYRQQDAADAPGEWESDDEPTGDLPEHTLRHYLMTMVALAGNAEAAGAFVKARRQQR